MHGPNTRFLAFVCVSFLLLLAGCDQASIMKRWASPQDEVAARNYVDLLRQSQFDQIEKDLDPSLEGPYMRSTLSGMALVFPAQQPVSVKVVGINSFHDAYSSTNNITLEYEFPDKWLLANVVIKRADGVATIVGFHVSPIRDSPEHLNRFTLDGKSAGQYATLLAGVLVLVLSFYAFVVCLRTRMGKGKWFWSIMCLVGVGQLSIDWTTGQSNLTAFAVRLVPFSAVAPLYGAWVVYVSLPVGAVLFLYLRDRGYWSRSTPAPAIPHGVQRPAEATLEP
jgi:hypothetical protein